jgi:gas vesicle protein
MTAALCLIAFMAGGCVGAAAALLCRSAKRADEYVGEHVHVEDYR